MKKLLPLLLLAVLLVGCEDEETPFDGNSITVDSSVVWDGNDIIWGANTHIHIDPNTPEWWVLTPFDQITILLDPESIENPFTLTIDGVDKQFTHEEFRRRLGFKR